MFEIIYQLLNIEAIHKYREIVARFGEAYV